MARTMKITIIVTVMIALLFGEYQQIAAGNERKTVKEAFSIGKYDPVITLYDLDDPDMVVMVAKDGSLSREISAELSYQQKTINNNRYVKTVNKQRFVAVQSEEDGYFTIEEYGGNRILTTSGNSFGFDYPKRDKYGRFVIEERHLFRFEWSGTLKGWNIYCKDGTSFHVGDENAYRIVQVNYSERY